MDEEKVSPLKRLQHLHIFAAVILSRADGRLTVTREEYEAIGPHFLKADNQGKAGLLTIELIPKERSYADQ